MVNTPVRTMPLHSGYYKIADQPSQVEAMQLGCPSRFGSICRSAEWSPNEVSCPNTRSRRAKWSWPGCDSRCDSVWKFHLGLLGLLSSAGSKALVISCYFMTACQLDSSSARDNWDLALHLCIPWSHKVKTPSSKSPQTVGATDCYRVLHAT